MAMQVAPNIHMRHAFPQVQWPIANLDIEFRFASNLEPPDHLENFLSALWLIR